MSDRMNQEQWKKFCDPSKNPEIFAYLQASGKDFEQTRKDFNAVARKEDVKFSINAIMLGLTFVNAISFCASLLTGNYGSMCVNLFAGILTAASAASNKTTRGATKKALIERANQYAQTGHYRPY